jgi:CRISPR-associated protein Csd1
LVGKNLVFQLDGDMAFVHDRPKIKDIWIKHFRGKKPEVVSTCLVSGRTAPIARLHPDIKGVRGAQPKGAAIVSFNLDAFASYGKMQNYNAPVSEEIAFTYTAVLNELLRFESTQKVQIGDATTVFWTERKSPIEGFMGIILAPREDRGEVAEVRRYLHAVRDGKHPSEIDPDIKFFILGLSPNASRLSVRFWHVSTVGDIGAKIGKHFRDLSISKSYQSDPDFPGMWQLLRETAAQGKNDNISPLLAGAVTRSILTGAIYPRSLLSDVINRIRADQRVNYLRASAIKGCLVRGFRPKHITKEVSMVLDKESKDVAYRLGRLFAVLEKAQKDAMPGARATIKNKFFGSASATPRMVFPQLLRIAQHHLNKAEYGWYTHKLIKETMEEVREFPPYLSLDEQGMFTIGYYHQRNSFFEKSKEQKGPLS